MNKNFLVKIMENNNKINILLDGKVSRIFSKRQEDLDYQNRVVK